jgi:hypothetical protein
MPPKSRAPKRMGRPPVKPPGAKKLQVYLAPEVYSDLKAGSFRFGKSMTLIVEEQVAAWAETNRDALDQTKKALKKATGG